MATPCFVMKIKDPKAMAFWEAILEVAKQGEAQIPREPLVEVLGELGVSTSKTSVKDHLKGRCKSCQK